MKQLSMKELNEFARNLDTLNCLINESERDEEKTKELFMTVHAQVSAIEKSNMLNESKYKDIVYLIYKDAITLINKSLYY